MKQIKHKINGGSIVYDSEGLHLRPTWLSQMLFIPWNDIDFISTSPCVHRQPKTWLISDESYQISGVSLHELNRFTVYIVLINRISFFKTGNLFAKWWMLFFLNYKPLYAENKPEPARGVIALELRLESLTHPLNELLELIERNSKFGMLIHD